MRFKTNDGLSLAYQDEAGGPGTPLLCLAGLTRSGRDFDHFAGAMKGRRRLIRLDSRGRGGSDHDPDFSCYNGMVEAGDAVALLHHLGIERVVVIGSSRGGVLAAVIAAKHPGRLAGVVLNDVGAEIETDGIGKVVAALGVQPQAATMAEAAAEMEARLGAAFPGAGRAFWTDWAERSYVATESGLALAYDPRLRDATLAQMEAAKPDGPGLWPLFDALGPIPTLVLRAANSDLLSAATVTEMQRRKPDLRAAVIPDRGHIPRLDEPAALTAINSFLDSLDD